MPDMMLLIVLLSFDRSQAVHLRWRFSNPYNGIVPAKVLRFRELFVVQLRIQKSID